VVGAYLGSLTGAVISEWFSPEVSIALSIVLTVGATVILLKVDLGKLTEKSLNTFAEHQRLRQRNLNSSEPMA
jgi:hypothetical protein